MITLYGIIAIELFHTAFDSYQNVQSLKTILFGLFGIYLVYGIINCLNNSANPIIYRQKIKEVKVKQAVKGLTRSRFEVLFGNEKGKIKKRLILLPGSLNKGQNETKKAVEIMKDEQLLN